MQCGKILFAFIEILRRQFPVLKSSVPTLIAPGPNWEHFGKTYTFAAKVCKIIQNLILNQVCRRRYVATVEWKAIKMSA